MDGATGPEGRDAARRRWWRFGSTRAFKAALLNLGVGLTAVALATAFNRADLGAALAAALIPPLLVVTLFHALRDLLTPGPKSEAPVQAWFALLISLAPVLLLVIFLLAANLQAVESLRQWVPWPRK
jgi:hypothetical protein